MKKHKSPSDLNTRLLRANVDTYLIVKGLSRQFNISMADALDKLITDKALIEKAQISMPIIMAKSMPVTTTRQRSMPISISLSRKVKDDNGYRQTNGR